MHVLDKIAALTEAGGSFTLDWNDHRAVHESVAQKIDTNDYYDFENEAEIARAIEQNTIVVLQWYPRTSVSFMTYAAPDLESLFAWLEKDLAQ